MHCKTFEIIKDMVYIKNGKQDLLLKYLCMALPYDVMIGYESNIYILNEIDPSCKDIGYITARIQDVERLMCAENVMIENIRPYLRPMSSMTEEEIKEYHKLCDSYYGIYFDSVNSVIWLLENHFDFMGLILNGLAIEVKESNNPYKN